MTAWPVPKWPDPRLRALQDAVDAFLCGLILRDQLQAALRTSLESPRA